MTTSLTDTTADAQSAAAPPQPSESRLTQLRHRPEAGALIGTLSVFVFFAIFGGERFLAAAGAA
ncbi:ABC transporter permease, partial [Streptomyces sp. NPDC056948]